MKIFVSLRDTLNDNYSATVEHEWEYDVDGLIYQYRDGNYGCACNRSLFLYDHRGLEDPYHDEQRPWNDGYRPCGIVGQPTIVIDKIISGEGELLYSETAKVFTGIDWGREEGVFQLEFQKTPDGVTYLTHVEKVLGY